MLEAPALYAADGWDIARLVELLHGEGVAVGAPRRVVRTVLDTFDGLVHAAGLRLTAHTERGAHTVSLTGDDVVGVQITLGAEPVWPTDLPPGPLRSRLVAIVDVRALLPVVRIDTVERDAVRYDGRRKEILRATVVEAARVGDTALVTAPLVEVVPLVGYPKPATELADVLVRRGARRLDGDLVGLTGVDLGGYSASPTVPLEPQMPALAGWCAVLANLASTARANWAGTLAQIDTEFLHELRVAVRRSRSILGHAEGIIPDDVLAPAADGFAAIGTATGPARDFDVQLLAWPEQLARLGSSAADLEPVHDLLVERHRAAHAALDAALTDPATIAWLDAWCAWLADPGDGSGAPLGEVVAAPLGDVVAARIRKAHKRIIRDGRQITPDSPPEALHDLRKQAKKLRYLLECFASLLPDAERKRFVKALKVLQDNLGEHQDAEVHVQELRDVGTEVHRLGAPAGTMFALGELSAQIDGQRAAARAEFAERFAEFDTEPTRQALRAMLADLES